MADAVHFPRCLTSIQVAEEAKALEIDLQSLVQSVQASRARQQQESNARAMELSTHFGLASIGFTREAVCTSFDSVARLMADAEALYAAGLLSPGHQVLSKEKFGHDFVSFSSGADDYYARHVKPPQSFISAAVRTLLRQPSHQLPHQVRSDSDSRRGQLGRRAIIDAAIRRCATQSYTTFLSRLTASISSREYQRRLELRAECDESSALFQREAAGVVQEAEAQIAALTAHDAYPAYVDKVVFQDQRMSWDYNANKYRDLPATVTLHTRVHQAVPGRISYGLIPMLPDANLATGLALGDPLPLQLLEDGRRILLAQPIPGGRVLYVVTSAHSVGEVFVTSRYPGGSQLNSASRRKQVFRRLNLAAFDSNSRLLILHSEEEQAAQAFLFDEAFDVLRPLPEIKYASKMNNGILSLQVIPHRKVGIIKRVAWLSDYRLLLFTNHIMMYMACSVGCLIKRTSLCFASLHPGCAHSGAQRSRSCLRRGRGQPPALADAVLGAPHEQPASHHQRRLHPDCGAIEQQWLGVHGLQLGGHVKGADILPGPQCPGPAGDPTGAPKYGEGRYPSTARADSAA